MKTIQIISNNGGVKKLIVGKNKKEVNVYANIEDMEKCCWFLREILVNNTLEFPSVVHTRYTLEMKNDRHKCVLANLNRYTCAICTTKVTKL